MAVLSYMANDYIYISLDRHVYKTCDSISHIKACIVKELLYQHLTHFKNVLTFINPEIMESLEFNCIK